MELPNGANHQNGRVRRYSAGLACGGGGTIEAQGMAGRAMACQAFDRRTHLVCVRGGCEGGG